MPNHNDSDTPAPDPDDQSPPQPPVIPAAPLQGALANDGKRKANNEKNETQELAREFRKAEKWAIGTNIVLAFIGIGALYIYNGQLQVMRGQLGEIIKQYPQLQKSAEAAAAQIVKMEESNVINREALESVQRAYITFPPSPQVHIIRTPNEQYVTLEMPIENAGATQAHKLIDRVSWMSTMAPPFPTRYLARPQQNGMAQ